MTKVPLCIYHSPCADGFMAACIVDRFFGIGAIDMLPANYGNTLPASTLVADRDVYIVDFSYPESALRFIAEHANRVLVIDHHKTAAENLANLKPPVRAEWRFRSSDLDPIIDREPRALFDMDRSGAGLTWDFFFHDTPRPRIVNMVEDRDLWRFALPGSKEFAARLFAEPYDRGMWGSLIDAPDTWLDHMVREGAVLIKKQSKDIAELLSAQAGRMEEIGGHLVPVFNLPYYLASDALHIACQGLPFAASYWDGPTHRNFSLRSDRANGGVDVSAVAREYGGGGHAEAAGFRIYRQRGATAVGC